jgi:hypothetical protein
MPQYPFDFNLLTNATVYAADSIYTLGKAAASTNYTLSASLLGITQLLYRVQHLWNCRRSLEVPLRGRQ